MSTFTISLRDIIVYANHGVMEQERLVGNEFSVTVSLTIEASPFMDSESNGLNGMDSTINYAEMAEIVVEEMSKPSALLESVALRIGKRLQSMGSTPVLGGKVEIVKIKPPIPIQTSGASVCYAW